MKISDDILKKIIRQILSITAKDFEITYENSYEIRVVYEKNSEKIVHEIDINALAMQCKLYVTVFGYMITSSSIPEFSDESLPESALVPAVVDSMTGNAVLYKYNGNSFVIRKTFNDDSEIGAIFEATSWVIDDVADLYAQAIKSQLAGKLQK